jgi:hypothetical protein
MPASTVHRASERGLADRMLAQVRSVRELSSRADCPTAARSHGRGDHRMAGRVAAAFLAVLSLSCKGRVLGLPLRASAIILVKASVVSP